MIVAQAREGAKMGRSGLYTRRPAAGGLSTDRSGRYAKVTNQSLRALASSRELTVSKVAA